MCLSAVCLGNPNLTSASQLLLLEKNLSFNLTHVGHFKSCFSICQHWKQDVITIIGKKHMKLIIRVILNIYRDEQ